MGDDPFAGLLRDPDLGVLKAMPVQESGPPRRALRGMGR